MSEETCEEAVIRRIRERREAGLEKYGTSVERTDLTHGEWLRHAQEEAMDLAIYLERLRREAARERYEASMTEHLLGLVADIRAAAGDPEGELMQEELIERVRDLRERVEES